MAEPVDKNLDQGGVDQPADAETGDGQADQRKTQSEAQAQVGADIGEGAPHDRALDEGGENDDAREWIAQHDGVVGDEALPPPQPSPACGGGQGGGRMAGLARQRIGDELEHQARRGQCENAGEHEEHIAPAHQVAEHAAGGLAGELAENLAGQVAAEHGLAVLIGRDVADIGHGDRNHPAGSRAGREPRQHELRQRTGQAAARHQHGADGAHQGDGAVFAEAVADRADDQLDRAVGESIGRHHHGGGADGGVEVGGDLGQQRIGHPHLRLRGEARDREQHDRARRRAVRQRRGSLRGGCHVGLGSNQGWDGGCRR